MTSEEHISLEKMKPMSNSGQSKNDFLCKGRIIDALIGQLGVLLVVGILARFYLIF